MEARRKTWGKIPSALTSSSSIRNPESPTNDLVLAEILVGDAVFETLFSSGKTHLKESDTVSLIFFRFTPRTPYLHGEKW